MDKLHKPKQDYVPTAVPPTNSSMLIRRTKFVVRDFDGSKVFEGTAIIEEDNCTHETTVVMSTLMAFSMMEELRKHFFIGSEEEPEKGREDEILGRAFAPRNVKNDGNYCDPDAQTGNLYGGN